MSEAAPALDLKNLTPEQQQALFATLTAAMQPAPEPEPMLLRFAAQSRARAERHQTPVVPGYNVLKSWPLIIVGLILCALVWHVAPAKMLLITYGLAKGIVFALSGALTDYLLFPDDAPEALDGVAQGTSWKRRALIVFGFLIVAAQVP